MASMTPEQRTLLLRGYFGFKFPGAVPQIQALMNKPGAEIEELTGDRHFFGEYATHALTVLLAHQVRQLAESGRRGRRTGLVENAGDCLEAALATAAAIPRTMASSLALPVLNNIKEAADSIKRELRFLNDNTSYPRLDDGLANEYCSTRTASPFKINPELLKRAAPGPDYRNLAQKAKQALGPAGAAHESQLILAWVEHEFATRQLEQMATRLQPSEQQAWKCARASWLPGSPPGHGSFDRKLLRALVRSPLAESQWASELNQPSFFIRIRLAEDRDSLHDRRARLEWSQYETEEVASGVMDGNLTETTGKFTGGGKQLELRLTSVNPYFMEAIWTPDDYKRNPMMFFGRLE